MTSKPEPTKKPAITPQTAYLIGTKLQALPQKPKASLTAHDVVDLNRAAIRAALEKGYSFADVAQLMVDGNVQIGASTLAHYMRNKSKATQRVRVIKSEATAPQPNATAMGLPPRSGNGPAIQAHTQSSTCEPLPASKAPRPHE